MPILVAWIGEMLLSTIGQMVLSGLVAAGIGFASHSAVSAVIPGMDEMQAMLGQAGPLLPWIGYFGIDKAMTVVMSAWAGRKIVDAAHVSLVARRGRVR